jgi:two-component system, oxyanion-binding sensor
MLPEYPIAAGFMPLTDSLLLVVAKERGFAAAEGVDLRLLRETSWANIRDRIAVGQVDVAHMLAPMPIAAALGLTPIAAPLIAPMALGLGGNAVTVSKGLWQQLESAGADRRFDPASVGAALARIVASGGRRLRFGVVHPHSSHNYELRYWLAACGVHPGRDVDIVVLPPPLMPDALGTGGLDGYCVGEPWNSVAVASGQGRIATVKAAIWRSSPEKVLGANAGWAERHPEALAAVLRALYQASLWCDDRANLKEAAALLGARGYLGMPAELILRGLSGRMVAGDGEVADVPDFFVPHARNATFPWSGHALWFYTQMVRWGDVTHSAARAGSAAASYRPDLYARALQPLGASVPSADVAIDPDSAGGFFDGKPFDPGELDRYLEGQRQQD